MAQHAAEHAQRLDVKLVALHLKKYLNRSIQSQCERLLYSPDHSQTAEGIRQALATPDIARALASRPVAGPASWLSMQT